jgi:hypothetical protein
VYGDIRADHLLNIAREIQLAAENQGDSTPGTPS